MHVERGIETEGLNGIDHRFCGTHPLPAIAISDGEVHVELVLGSREEDAPFMQAMDCACYATGKPSVI